MPENQDPGDGAQGNPPAGGPDPKSDPKPEDPKPITFKSQEELDRIIADRVARAKPKDYDELVALRDRVAAEEEAKKTEAQKEKEAQQERDRKAAEKSALADKRLIRAEIVKEATAGKAVDPDTIVALLAGDADIAVDDAGNVTGVKEAVKKLLKDKPFLAGQTGGGSGGQFGGNDQRTLDEKIRELEQAGKYAEARDLKIQKGLSQ